jgi:hypothetical protein
MANQFSRRNTVMHKIINIKERQSLADTLRLMSNGICLFLISLLVLLAAPQTHAARVSLRPPAHDVTVSLSPVDIQAFTPISATGSPVTFKTSQSVTGASFTTVWSFAVNGPNSADIGLTGISYDWSRFETFSLNIANNNESAWSFKASVSDGVNTATSATQSLAPSPASVFTAFNVDLLGLDLTAITSIFVTVSGDLPINGFDRTAEYTIATEPMIAAVPVPAATWLFGSALGLLFWVRKRQYPVSGAE